MRDRRGRNAAALLLVVALLLTGCSGKDGKPKPAATTENPQARSVSKLVPAHVKLAVTGAEAFTWEGPLDLRLARTGVLGGPVNLLSIGIEAPHKTEDPLLRFRWAFDLLNAYDDKPGTFTIDADKDASGDLRSMAFFILLKVKEAARDKAVVEDWAEVEYLKEFRKLEQACTLVIGEQERTGSLSCPKLADDKGEISSLEVSWEATDGLTRG